MQVQHDMLQALVLLLLVARLLQKLSFQPYISVITTTLTRAAPDFTAFLGELLLRSSSFMHLPTAQKQAYIALPHHPAAAVVGSSVVCRPVPFLIMQ
jgi:hypothetical protein